MAKPEKKEKNRRFFKDFKAELKKVVWPTPKQMVNNTTAVITIVLITAAIVFVLDITFDALNKYGINQLRSKIESSDTAENNENTANTVTENETVEETTDSDETAPEENSNEESVEGNNVEE